MYSSLIWWPEGLRLWFQTWDIPSAIAVWPLWGWVPNLALYNLPLFLSFPLAGFTCYLLCLELWGDTLAAFLAGCLYTFSTFHFGQGLANLHIVSMQWSPLYFLGMIRTLRYRDLRGPILAGVGLALATLASSYHLLFCAAGTVLFLAFEWCMSETFTFSWSTCKRFAVAGLVFVAMAGWLLAGMWHAYRLEPYTGAHDAVQFSADLQSFFLPNAVSAWSGWSNAWQIWTGSQWSSSGYIGYVAIVLASVAAWRVPAARAFVFVACAGAYLALGPALHIAGVVYGPAIMPYAWIARAIPLLRFGGIPSRFSWLTAFGLAVAAGATLARLSGRGRMGRALAMAITMLSLVETWPHAFTTSLWPTPAIMRTWAADSSEWAVLDATAWPRALWHQTIHHHPMLAGYATRVPERLWNDIRADLVISRLYPPPIGPAAPVMPDVPAADVRARLHALHVRFVIEDAANTSVTARLGLDERYDGDGIVVYEVP